MADDIKIVIGVDSAPVDRAVRVMDNLEAEARGVERAFKKGLITEKKYNAETVRLTNSMDRLKVVAEGSAKDFRTFEKAVYGSGKALRAKEVQMQQAGYQLQDFIVQVQAGTNPLIAFSQQGSQLAGFFAGPWGAAIGLGIAALGGLGTALLSTTEKSKSAQEQFDSLSDAISGYVDATERAADSEALVDQFGALAENAKGILEALKELQKISLKKQLQEFGNLGQLTRQTVKVKTGEIFGFFPTSEDRQVFGKDQMEGAKGFLGLPTQGDFETTNPLALQFLETLEDIQRAGSYKELAESAKELSKFLRETVDVQSLSKEQYEDLQGLQKVLLDLTKLAGQETLDTVEAEEEYAERLARIRRIMGDIEQERRKEAAERKRIAESTENTDKLRHEMELRRAELLEDFYERKRKRAREADQEALRAQELLARATESAISNQLSQQESLQVEIAEVGAAIEAVKNGQDASVASFIAGELAKAEAAYEVAKSLAIQDNNLIALAEAALTFADVEEALGKLKELRTELSTLEDGKSSGKSTTESNLQRLEKQLDLQKELRNKTLVEQQLIKSLGAEYSELGAGVLERLRGLIIKQEEYNKVVAQQEDIANAIAGGFGDAFMSIVDGTKSAKEAFSDMARHIIARLFEILVIEQMVQSIAGAISGSFGGVPRTAVDGTPVPPTRVYDGGGYTGSGSRSGGLDGRGGFMAMLHPRETVVDHTKPNQAMSQQPVVINQSFNFAANGDDSVKRIIAQEAPKIAQMTQQQILEQRRRGGQMKAAFS